MVAPTQAFGYVVVERQPNLLKIMWPDGVRLEILYGVKYKQCVPILKRIGGRRITIGEVCREAQAILSAYGHELLIDGKYATYIKRMLSRFPDDVFEVRLPVSAMDDVRRFVEEVVSQMVGG